MDFSHVHCRYFAILIVLMILFLSTSAVGMDQWESPFGFHPARVQLPDYPDNGYFDAQRIGVGWTRPGVYAFWFMVQKDLSDPTLTFTFYDNMYSAIPAQINILGNIAPQGNHDEGYCLQGSFLPVNSEQYQRFVTALVERYDGDGHEDMPGLTRPIKHWQVGNEPDSTTKTDFAELQRLTYQAVKAADPDAQVLIGGVPGMPTGYIQSFNEKFLPILEALAGNYVDIFDFHWYGNAFGHYVFTDPDTGDDVLSCIQNSLAANGFSHNTPIWITEMGSYSGAPDEPGFTFQSEDQQAADYFKRYIYSLNRGVKKVFSAFGLDEGFTRTNGYFDYTGLIYDGWGDHDSGIGVKKKGYYTYWRMTRILNGCDWDSMTPVSTGSDYVSCYHIQKDGQGIWIAWYDTFNNPDHSAGHMEPLTIQNVKSQSATVVNMVPTGRSMSAFNIVSQQVTEEEVTVLLGEDPLVIMEHGVNLLSNHSFEYGTDDPAAWSQYSPSGDADFVWDDSYSCSGVHSVRIDNFGTDMAMWHQIVPVTQDTVYRLTGQVGFEQVEQSGRCFLQVVFRNGAGQSLEMIDLPSHSGERPFEIDFPSELKVRSPALAVTAEINCCLEGRGSAWFDDIVFSPAPAGAITGQVTMNGQPVANATVSISGQPWNSAYSAVTGMDGDYFLSDLPVSFPRYVMLADSLGYRTCPVGDISVVQGMDTAVDFQLVPGDNPDDLLIRFGSLSLNPFEEGAVIPQNAVIPDTPNGYPEVVRVYLQSDQYIQSDHPAIIQLASQLIQSVPPQERSDTRLVAWTVHEWVCRNIEHDGVYEMPGTGLNTPFKDVTSGIWQTIGFDKSSGEGWCWGRNFYDWAYSAGELLDHSSGICVEHSRLMAALYRALNIPARKSVGSHEYYVQTDINHGVWIHGSTTGGRTAYRVQGDMIPGFEGYSPERSFSTGSHPIIHEDWNCVNKGLWRERHPWNETYPATQEGYEQATADLLTFSQNGQASSVAPTAPGEDSYTISYSDITLNLLTMGDQRILDVRFPLVTHVSDWSENVINMHWTNHPECVVETWVEQISNPPAIGVERWYHVVFDLTSMLGPGPAVMPTPTPTPECQGLGVELWMPSDSFTIGDPCECRVMVCNPYENPIEDAPLFVILDVYGMLFFAPDFSQWDYYLVDILPGRTTQTVIPQFIWPDIDGSAEGIAWYAALTDAAVTETIGTVDTWMFGWN